MYTRSCICECVCMSWCRLSSISWCFIITRSMLNNSQYICRMSFCSNLLAKSGLKPIHFITARHTHHSTFIICIYYNFIVIFSFGIHNFLFCFIFLLALLVFLRVFRCGCCIAVSHMKFSFFSPDVLWANQRNWTKKKPKWNKTNQQAIGMKQY